MENPSPDRRSRRDLPVRITRLADQGKDEDVLAMTPAERLAMMWPLALDAWAVMGEPIDDSPLQRDKVRLLCREAHPPD